MGIWYYIKSKPNAGHKAVLNCTIPYLVALMITGFEFSEDPKNDQINLWPECNPMTVNKTIVEV